eukprot:m.503965 g.503965  ORF g.503965 m.503965 type:complete len:97 (+) comp57349_c0_seq11:271-561(+)
MCLQWVLQCLGLRPRTQKYAQFPRSRKHHDDTLLQTFEDDSEEERSHFEDRILASSPMRVASPFRPDIRYDSNSLNGDDIQSRDLADHDDEYYDAL